MFHPNQSLVLPLAIAKDCRNAEHGELLKWFRTSGREEIVEVSLPTRENVLVVSGEVSGLWSWAV